MRLYRMIAERMVYQTIYCLLRVSHAWHWIIHARLDHIAGCSQAGACISVLHPRSSWSRQGTHLDTLAIESFQCSAAHPGVTYQNAPEAVEFYISISYKSLNLTAMQQSPYDATHNPIPSHPLPSPHAASSISHNISRSRYTCPMTFTNHSSSAQPRSTSRATLPGG